MRIEEGVEGLVHVSEMDWTNANARHLNLLNWVKKLMWLCWMFKNLSIVFHYQ
ncbi:SSU ribosomal protein S1p [uncultured Gammaproteobacteria bacterium]|nr:SSU ribosomal protein S1p [uncultured Gammaproteobacteria bacterium]